MTLNLTVIVTGLLVCVSAVAAPQTASDSPSFEVASVRLAPPDARVRSVRGGPNSSDPGQITYVNMTLKLLMVRAFGARASEITGPDWIDNLGFDIVAKIPPGTTEGRFRIMLQKLLEERFAMRIHREAEESPVYALVAGKGQPMLQPAQGTGNSGCKIASNGGRIDWTSEIRVECRNVTIGALAEQMPFFARVNRRFVDATHLDGVYDFDLRWTPAPPQSGPGSKLVELESKGALFNALEKQLGLRIDDRKAPVETIVVDQINKVPVEN